MQAAQRKDSKHFFYSLLLHVVLLVALIISFQFSGKTPVLQNSDKNTEVINAMVIGAPPMPTPVKVAQQQPSPPQPVFPQPVKPIPPKPKAQQVVAKKPDAIIIPNKKQQKIQQQKIADDLLSDLKKQTQVQKKIKHKEVLNEFEKEMKALSAKSLQQQMLKEQKSIAGARAQQMKGVVDKYKALILQVIAQNWLIPGGIDKHLSAELLIRVAPGGVVLDVQVVKSSGNDGLDRSARAAIFKSSPLPVPPDSDAFEPFRQFLLKAAPENVLASDNWMS